MWLQAVLISLFVQTNVDGNLSLEGTLGEYYGEPVTVHCSNERGYIRLGGITVNNIPLTSQQHKFPERQCEKQMERVESDRKKTPLRSGYGTDCVLTFPKMNVNATDTVRIVYKCYDFKPSGSPPWSKSGKENSRVPTNTVTKTTIGQARVQCRNQQEMIFITEATINGVKTIHKDLQADKLTQFCFEQVVEIMKSGKKSDSPTCYIENKAEYGGSLQLSYKCLDQGKEKIKLNSEGELIVFEEE